MTPVRLLIRLAVIGAALAAATLAAAAAKPAPAKVGAQTVQKSGASPVEIPGQHPAVRTGTRLRRGQRLVARGVTLRHGRRVALALTCPKGTVQRGLGIGEASTVAFAVINVKRYIGVRRVAIRASTRVRAGHTASGHVYGLCS